MVDPRQYPLPRERNVILGALLVLSAAAWVVLVQQSLAVGADAGMGAATDLTMGFGAPLFMALWVVMMIAMMFPSAAPMTLMFARVAHGKGSQGQPFVPAWVFVAGYLAVWTGFGLIAYLLAAGLSALAMGSEAVVMAAPRLGGAVLVLAGLYQLSPLKHVCLKKCRSPFEFIATSWREGYGGALRMGVEHGAYCAGCCWMLMAILFPLGMMNVAMLALVALLIFAEKVWVLGVQASRVAAAALIVFGLVVVVMPGALPTTM